VEYAEKRELFKNRKHPYTIGLFNSVPKMTGDETRLQPIPGLPPDPTNLPEGCRFAERCKYATERCRQAKIPLTEVAPGHFCRCCRMDEPEE
jgi:peptide/nickel transport system ATP-binding protein